MVSAGRHHDFEISVIRIPTDSVENVSPANHSKETDMRKKLAIALTAGVAAATVGIAMSVDARGSGFCRLCW